MFKQISPMSPSENIELKKVSRWEASVQVAVLLHKQHSNFFWSFLKQEEISRSVISKGQIFLITLQGGLCLLCLILKGSHRQTN